MKDNLRIHARKYLIADIKIKKAGKRPVSAVAVNISSEGVGLYTTKPLAPRDRIGVKMTVLMDGEQVVSEEITGTVRWIKPIGKNYCAGVRFDKRVTRADYPVISRCISYASGRR